MNSSEGSTRNEPARATAEQIYAALGFAPEQARMIARMKAEEEEAPPGIPDFCPRCGGAVREEDVASTGDPMCRCGRVESKLLSFLDAVDPERKMTLDAFDVPGSPGVHASWSAPYEAALRILSGERQRGMLLMGSPGQGKTHLAVAVGRALLERGRHAGFYNAVRVVARIQDTYRSGTESHPGDTRYRIIEEIASREIVILDDLGKERASPDVDSIIYELLDTLYARRRIVIATTNLDAPKIVTRYPDEATRSRLRALCQPFGVEGEDRRLRGDAPGF